MTKLYRYLWSSSRNQFTIESSATAERILAHMTMALTEHPEYRGRVVNRGFKIWRSRLHARSRNTFAPILYGTLSSTERGSRVDGHFQLNPVMRLFLIIWFGGTTLLALALLGVALLRTTPDSTAGDALPYLLPALLPLLGLMIVRWQQQRGRADEVAVRAWLQEVIVSVEQEG